MSIDLYELTTDLKVRLAKAVHRPGRVIALTGAGISAESGIPTFRGPGGFWTIGSQVYRSEEISTFEFFAIHPEQSWAWFLWRRNTWGDAQPNAAHRALVRLEQALGERFVVITQNIDGLHLAAGHNPERVYEGHGNLQMMRCSAPCGLDVYPIPPGIGPTGRDEPLGEEDRDLLVCPKCGAMTRPHVLWFDETYNEEHYRIYSARIAAQQASLLLVIGTSGSTRLPNDVFAMAGLNGATLVDINPEPNPFSLMAERMDHGLAIKAPATVVVPPIVDFIEEVL
ncbi:MAG: RNA polymerase subunit sigma [Acidimicrobiia bacterium]|nr:RNA polymerase subunit sigma [Acidimicrobiia bacterium]